MDGITPIQSFQPSQQGQEYSQLIGNGLMPFSEKGKRQPGNVIYMSLKCVMTGGIFEIIIEEEPQSIVILKGQSDGKEYWLTVHGELRVYLVYFYDDNLQRNGNDLTVTICVRRVCGGRLKYSLRIFDSIEIPIETMIEEKDKELVFKGYGLPSESGYSVGNLIVKIVGVD
ncbi:hypothetical protein EDI_230570 [Entamoeba dispar SAW760]|uniref:Uncharacterized protein n=1 Tax=Entamoeba dispar (strain ATCC PRA-260 / SAW760) TaxID=370354 RepID=B0EQL1_ENTDS|nr:uncharacterized protein EDI_230570 [Entamoeba dispar SAW760]EDR23210.1 hypothetical protein EDI_230570 [Entamoeba dispar SAW760]|eukprot:EDR23210.1 hypothetical protein EDI_230570 [Entamoeba dispar SAW760]